MYIEQEGINWELAVMIVLSFSFAAGFIWGVKWLVELAVAWAR